MFFSSPLSRIAILSAPFALVACAQPQPLYVDQATIKLNPNASAPAAGYFTIHGGEQPAKLLAVTTDGALRIEMHQSAMENGMMTMKPVTTVDVPARTEVKFAPGGYHLMIFGINPSVVESGKLTMTMIFSTGDRLIVDAAIEKPAGGAGTTGGNMAMPANGSDHAH